MGEASRPDWLRLPGRREAIRRRLRARLDEQVLVLRVLHARARRRTADATLRALDALELTRGRVEVERRAAAERLLRLRAKLRRLVSPLD